jgi:glucose/arabinose dehydrogenase
MVRIPLAAALSAGLTLTLATSAVAQEPGVFRRSAYHDYRVVTVADGLVNPWSIAFLPNGDVLVTERPGRLRIIRDGELLPTPVPGVPEVLAEGQGGLLDVAPHPDFASNRLLYLSYSKPYADEEGATTAIGRGRLENDRLEDFEDIFVANSRGRGHYGSRIVFDGDGHIFFGVGDRQAPPQGDLASHPAQDRSNHHGTINRIHEDGRIPDDNPFVGQDGIEPSIWSYGHRNPQGLVLHPETGDLWETEHGPQGGDELNVIQAGANYGWPVIGFGVNYGSGAAIHGGTMDEGMEAPLHFWVPSIALSGLMVYTGDRFPAWRGNIFAGGMAGEQLARLTLDGHVVVNEETLVQRMGRIRDVRQGPDGYIYLAIDDRGGAETPVVRLEPAN